MSGGEAVEFGEWVRRKREEAGLSMNQLAKRSGLSEKYIRLLERGERRPKVETLKKLALGLGVPFEEVAEAAGLEVGRVEKVLVVPWSWIKTWGATEVSSHGLKVADHASEEHWDWVEVVLTSPRAFALRVSDDSMEPEFTEGDIIVLDPTRRPTSGSFVVVCNGRGEAMLRQLKVYGDKQILCPLNPKYPEIDLTDEYEIVGVVCQKIKKY